MGGGAGCDCGIGVWGEGGWQDGRTLLMEAAWKGHAGVVEALVKAVSDEALAGDHVLIMSNGAFGGIHAMLLERLAARDG